jgi:hypothetical protein
MSERSDRRAAARRPAARGRQGRVPAAPAGAGAPRSPGGLAVPALGSALALAVRLWALHWQPFVTVDGTEYVRFAEALRAWRPFVSIFPPGYPVLIALARLLVPDRVLAAALVSLVCGVLLVWPVWWLGRRALGPRWAAFPVLAVALHPLLAVFSAVTMSESAYFLALYGGLALAGAARGLPSGLVLGVAFALRPEALVPVGALAAGALARTFRGRARSRAPWFAAAGFLAVAIPCWLWFHATLGTWTLTPKVGALRPVVTQWRQDEPRLAPAPAPHAGLVEILARNGPAALRQYPSNAVAHGRSLLRLWPAPLLLLSLAGLMRRRGVESLPLLHLAALPLLGLSVQPRFVLGAVPALAILAAIPLAAGRSAWRLAAAVLALVGLVWCGAGLARDLQMPFDGWIDAHRNAGVWLSGVAEPGAVVMDRKPWVAFYANRGYRVTPDEPYERLVSAAVRDSVRYLVVDQRISEIFRSQLEPLLYDEAFREREQRLELVYVGGRVAGYGIGIFRVLQPAERKSGLPPTVEAAYLQRPGGS